MAGVHEMKTYKCVHDASCIAIAKEIKNKIHKTHKTTVKQRKNKMKTSQNAHNRLSLEDLRITAQSVSIEDAAARAGK